MKINELIEKYNIKKVSAIMETRNRPDGNGTYDMLVMSVAIGGRVSSWKLGASKLRSIMKDYPMLLAEVEAFDFNAGTWRHDYEFPKYENSKFTNKPIKMTINHVASLYLFKDDIDKFIRDHTKVSRMPAITEVQYGEWINGYDVIPMIYLPCFEKQEGDTGDGLVPWALSAKKVSNMYKYYVFGNEDIDTHFEKWLVEHPNEDCVYVGTKLDGTTYEVVFKPEQVKAWVTYSKELVKFERKNH